MKIIELRDRLNTRRQSVGEPPLTDKQFLEEISIMEYQGKIEIDGDEVRSRYGRMIAGMK